MFNNHMVIALRHLGRNKGYTAINVLGLAIGMACVILTFLYVGHELSYDRYHAQADRIYRVVFNDNAKTSISVGPALLADFPEVQSHLRMHPTTGTWVMKYEDRIFYERAVYWADDSLFDFFTLPLVQGDPETALEAPYTLVISEDTARRYFGDEDPMGKTIVADNGFMLLTVTGVMKNMPSNTHFHADFFISLASGFEEYGHWSRENWDSFSTTPISCWAMGIRRRTWPRSSPVSWTCTWESSSRCAAAATSFPSNPSPAYTSIPTSRTSPAPTPM